jgi:hypothetical protein
MERAVDHLTANHAAGLPLRPGGRKTSITLAAFMELRAAGRAQTMLVVAPLRVCRQTWRQEAAKWEEFRELKFSLLHGPKKDARLEDDADIWLINPEGVDWLASKYFGRPLPFDVVTIDELTKFKNSSSERSKALRPRLSRVPYRWGLTGSLAPNGYMDLFGQMLMLDDGAALGKYITHYRDQYFQLGWDGFSYDLMPGAEKRIVDRIAPYWFQMDEEDYAQLPPLVGVPHELELAPAERKIYDRMKKDMIAQLPEGIITAANSAACYSKLSQMANGAVYVGDDKAKVSHIHDLKLDAIEDLLEELNGEPLLVAYEFNHDFARLLERFGGVDKETGRKVLPYLGKGTTAKQEAEWIAAWNRGELPLLCAHPASAGHGLNMQGASACNVAWFGITWDYELYDQFIRRIWRDGTKAGQVFNHLLLVKGTIDELKLVALRSKDMTQSGLLRALNSEIRRNADALAAGVSAVNDRRNEPVVMKLSRPGTAAAPAQDNAPADTGKVVTPKGWGKPAAAAAPAQVETQAPAAQQERIQENLRTGGSAFSGNVADKVASIQAEHGQDDARLAPGETAQEHLGDTKEAEKPRATRTRRSTGAGVTAPGGQLNTSVAPWEEGPTPEQIAEQKEQQARYERTRCLELACSPQFVANAESPDEIVEVAKMFHAYITGKAA